MISAGLRSAMEAPAASQLVRTAVAAVRVEVLTDAAGFETLGGEWDALLASSPSDCLFLTREWLSTWWKHLSGRRRLRLITVRRGGELIAIAPLALSPPSLRRLIPFPRLEFLGTGSVGSDYLDLIVRAGREREALHALAEHLGGAPLMLDLAQVNRHTALVAGLAQELAGRGWTQRQRPGDVCPFMGLAGLSWDGYLATLDSKHRSNFKRRCNVLTKRFDMRLEQAASEADRGPALGTLFDLHDRRWRDRGGSDALHTPALRAFHDEFTRRALARGWLRLFLMRLDGQPVASLYGLRYGRRFLFYQTGFDPEYGNFAVGQVTLGLTIKSAIDEGVEEYDLLHGAETYKFDWARSTRELERIELYPPGGRGRLQRALVELGRRARRVGRRILPRTMAAALTGGT